MRDAHRTAPTLIFRGFSLAVTLAAVAWSAACGDGGTEPPRPPNRAPTASGSIAAQTVTVGESATVNVAAAFSDPDGDQLSYTASTSAGGIATASVSGSAVTITGVAAGIATITVTARDPGGLTATQGISVTIEEANRAPVLLSLQIPPLILEVGDSITLDVEPFFSDLDGDPLTFTAETSDSTVVTGYMDGSVAHARAVGPGMATVSVTASDPGGLSATLTADVTVTQPNRPPMALAPQIEPATIAVGDTLPSPDLTQVFVDPDGDPLTYSAMSSDTSVLTVSVTGSVAVAVGVSAGTATVTITATDPEGLSASISGMLTVIQPNQAPVTTMGPLPPLSGEVGVTLPALDLASFFEDPDGDSLTFTAESSDTAVVRASLDSSVLTVSLVGVGTATLTVTATDPGGFSASLVADVTVGQGNQAPVAVAPEIDPATLAVGDSLGPLDLSQVFVDPDGDSLTFTAMSNDTSVVAVSVAGSSATVTAVGVGTATVTATATDPEGLSVSISGEITVIEGNQAPVTTVGPIPPLSGEVGVTLPALDLASFFEDPDGDALMFMAGSSDTAVATASLDGSMLAVSLVGAGTATVTVTATDPGGLSASLEASVTVTEPNQAPVTTMGPIPPLSGEVGAALPPIDLSSFFEDPDEDVLTFTAESDDTTVVTVAVDGSTLAVSLVAVGTATVTVTATDPGGLAASLSTQVTVVQQGNQAPMTTMGPIPPQIGAKDEVLPLEGDTLDVARYFEDPDGDELTFSVESSDEAVVTASLEGSLLMLEMVSVGTATVTVTATDPGDLSASLDAMVTVAPGSRPMVAEDEDLQALVGAFASFLRVGFTIPPTVIDLKAYFSDMDEGDELTFTAMSSDTDIAEVSVVEGSRLTGTLKKEGTVTVTVTATDPVGLSVSQSVEITVLPASG